MKKQNFRCILSTTFVNPLHCEAFRWKHPILQWNIEDIWNELMAKHTKIKNKIFIRIFHVLRYTNLDIISTTPLIVLQTNRRARVATAKFPNSPNSISRATPWKIPIYTKIHNPIATNPRWIKKNSRWQGLQTRLLKALLERKSEINSDVGRGWSRIAPSRCSRSTPRSWGVARSSSASYFIDARAPDGISRLRSPGDWFRCRGQTDGERPLQRARVGREDAVMGSRRLIFARRRCRAR